MGFSFKHIRCILPGIYIIFFTACENDLKEVENLARKTKEVEVGKNIEGMFSESAVLKARLNAPLMYRIKADTNYTEFPKSLHVDFFDDQKRVETVVKAKYGKYFDPLNLIYLKDSVVVYKVTGDTLHCEDLWWNQNQNVFYTDNPVRIHTPSQALTGSGLWALANFTKYSIKNPKGVVDIPKEIQY